VLGRVVVVQADRAGVVLGLLGRHVGGGRAALLRHQVVLGRVDRDAVEPGVELRLAAEARQGAVGADEGVLGHVLHLRRVAHEAADHGRDPVLVLAHQQVEGGLVPFLGLADQFGVDFVGARIKPHHANVGVGHAPLLVQDIVTTARINR